MTTATFDLDRTVRRAQRGDADAFRALVVRYKNLVFSVALGVLRDAEAAADVTQGVFVTTWQRIRHVRSGSSLPPWLRETARRQALHHLRSRTREAARVEAAPLPREAAAADDLLVEREESAALEVALDQLPTEVREVLLLYYSEAQSIDQVATLLELSNDAVKKRLQRARVDLRQEYERALERKMKRVLPGAALVAAILASIDGKAQAAPRSRMFGVVAASALAIVAGVVVSRSATTRSTSHPPIESVESGGVAERPKHESHLEQTQGHRTIPVATHEPAPPECDIDPEPLVQYAAHVVRDPKGNMPIPAQKGEVAERVVRASIEWFDRATRWRETDPPKSHGLGPSFDRDVVWTIHRCPTSSFWSHLAFLAPVAALGDGDASMDAWLDEVGRHATNARVYSNAAHFFAVIDNDLAESLLDEAMLLEPDNIEWSEQLARVHQLEMTGAAPDDKASAGQNALGHLDRALARVMHPSRRARILTSSAQIAVSLKEDGLARQRAEELLALTGRMQSAEDISDAVHHAHIVLGKVELHRESLDEAAKQLALAADVEGSRVLDSFGPDLELAQSLLERGRRSDVVRYLDRVARFWKHECIPVWRAKLDIGVIPDFATPWDCQATK